MRYDGLFVFLLYFYNCCLIYNMLINKRKNILQMKKMRNICNLQDVFYICRINKSLSVYN